MPEGFSTPEKYSKHQAAREIEEGVEEWFKSSKDKDNIRRHELAEQFDVVLAEKPMKRKDVEAEAANFVEKHFKELLPFLLAENQDIDQDAIIRRLRLTNKEIAMWGGAVFYSRRKWKEIYL